MTWLHSDTSSIGECIDRQCHDTHKSKWSRACHTIDLSYLV
jgi:hypothetical protein